MSWGDEMQAMCRLHEAAPDMLAALEAQEAACEFAAACPPSMTKEMHDKADQLFGRAAVLRRAAIAKASARRAAEIAAAVAELAKPVDDPETRALLADWRRIVDGT